MTVTPARTLVGAALALTACMLAWACQSSGGGADCFAPEHGPADPSCAGFVVGLSCPVNITAPIDCVCTQGAAAATAAGLLDAGPSSQTWVCTSVDSPGTGGCTAGAGGSGGSAGTGGKAGAGGSGTDGGT
jgi:hypothetical protein